MNANVESCNVLPAELQIHATDAAWWDAQRWDEPSPEPCEDDPRVAATFELLWSCYWRGLMSEREFDAAIDALVS